jgi:hypothetical protein
MIKMPRFSPSNAVKIRRLTAPFLPTALACLLLTACGIAANHKPIPPGTPTASIHFGPVRDGFVSQSVQVHDGEMCHPGEFARFHTIGAYLGSDMDVDIPANRKMFVSLRNAHGGTCSGTLCMISCTSSVSFSATPGTMYGARLVYQDKYQNACAVVVTTLQNGAPVSTQSETQKCLY